MYSYCIIYNCRGILFSPHVNFQENVYNVDMEVGVASLTLIIGVMFNILGNNHIGSKLEVEQ